MPSDNTRRCLAPAIFLLFLLQGAALADERLSDNAFDELRQEVQTELARRYAAAQNSRELFPGATLAFSLPDGRVATFATGYADTEKKLPMRPGSRMPSGSIGKTYVAAVALSPLE